MRRANCLQWFACSVVFVHLCMRVCLVCSGGYRAAGAKANLKVSAVAVAFLCRCVNSCDFQAHARLSAAQRDDGVPHAVDAAGSIAGGRARVPQVCGGSDGRR